MGQNLVAYLGITPAQPQMAVAALQHDTLAYVPADTLSVPDIVGSERAAVQEQLKRQGLTVICYGQGVRVQSQRPAPGAQVKLGFPVVLYFDPEIETSAASAPVVVPNVAGQSLRNAMQILGVYGLKAQVKGTGVVCEQNPRPNSAAQLGSVCSLTCLDPEVLP